MSEDLLDGEVTTLASRGISEETCRRYDYRTGKTSKGKKCHIANFRNQDGQVVAQHLRLAGKEFPWVGKKGKDLMLFGQHLVREGVSKLIITEGEIDAMSVAEALGPKSRFAAVSIISGAKGAIKDLSANLSFIERAEEIILMFDMDDPGREAAAECARLFRPGKVKIAELPMKDANEMLLAGRAAEIVDAVFAAKSWRPEGVVRLSDVKSRVLEAPVMGLPWWHKGLTDATFGRRMGELDALGAGTGVGKTDFLTQQIEFDINTLGEKVGLFFLEQQPFETVRRIAGKMVGRKFHIPPNDDNQWTQEELETAVDLLDRHDKLRMYDHFGSADYDLIEATIRYLYHGEGVRLFYIDHLTALASTAEDERKALEEIMAKLGGLVKELDIWVCLISHLATPDGKPHEEGGRVMIRHFKGSRSIGFWCHFMFGLERNQQAEDEDERQTTIFRVLKDRVSGQATGKTFLLGYDHVAGRLIDRDGSAFDGDDDGPAGF
jgi:twinkle protein